MRSPYVVPSTKRRCLWSIRISRISRDSENENSTPDSNGFTDWQASECFSFFLILAELTASEGEHKPRMIPSPISVLRESEHTITEGTFVLLGYCKTGKNAQPIHCSMSSEGSDSISNPLRVSRQLVRSNRIVCSDRRDCVSWQCATRWEKDQ